MNRLTPDNPEAVAQEQRRSKKMVQAGLMAAFGGGVGLALWILQRIFPGLTSSDSTNAMIDTFCLMLIAYAAIILGSFIFLRNWVLKINLIMVYAVIPGVLLKLFMDMN